MNYKSIIIMIVIGFVFIGQTNASGYPGHEEAIAPFTNMTLFKTTDCRECL